MRAVPTLMPRAALALTLATLLLGGCSGCSPPWEVDFFPDPSYECDYDEDCDDGVFCNGAERCVSTLAGGTACQGSWGSPCWSEEMCDEVEARCVDCAAEPMHRDCSPLDGGAAPAPCGAGCPVSEVCTTVRDGDPTCRRWCSLGLEGGGAGLGSGGHGAGCDVGDGCFWSEVEGEPRSGICAPGNYNDVPSPNIGAGCGSDAECYSPYGRGRCSHLAERATGICVVEDCRDAYTLYPGVDVPLPICPGDVGVCRAEDHTCHARCGAARPTIAPTATPARSRGSASSDAHRTTSAARAITASTWTAPRASRGPPARASPRSRPELSYCRDELSHDAGTPRIESEPDAVSASLLRSPRPAGVRDTPPFEIRCDA